MGMKMTRASWGALLLCGAIGGVVGFGSTTPRYQSVAMLDCSAPPLAIVFGSAAPKDYGFVDTVIDRIAHPRNLDPEALGVSDTELRAGLAVTRVKKTQLISVAYEDEDGARAATVAEAVATRGVSVFEDREAEAAKQRLGTIQSMIEELLSKPVTEETTRKLALLRERKEQLAKELAMGNWPGSPRVRFVAHAEVPATPSKDRRGVLAAVGALLGGVLAGGALALLSALRPRGPTGTDTIGT